MAIPSVTPGVFFNPRHDLPCGRHAMPRADALDAQRERLMAAFTEVVADRGLAETTVSVVVAHTGVSRAAFYACFDDIAGCGDAAYERFILVLLTRLGTALDLPANDWRGYYEAAIRAYLDALAADPVVARSMQIEMDTAGRPARIRRQAALKTLAEYLAARHAVFCQQDSALAPLPAEATLAIVNAVRQLACDALDHGDDLASLVFLPTQTCCTRRCGNNRCATVDQKTWSCRRATCSTTCPITSSPKAPTPSP